MGFKARLSKTSNVMGLDWEEAYWKIDCVRIDSNAQTIVVELKAYPTREAMLLQNSTLEADYQFGTPTSESVDCVLYTWQGGFPLATVFPDGIPTSLSDQKAILYPLVKQFLGITDWEDVLED